MRQKSETTKTTSEQVVKNIRRATRKHHSAEEKIRIVLDGLRGEYSIAELCRREGIAESLSTDRGVTWSVPKPSAIKHTASRFHISRLQSGNLLLVKHSAIDVDLASIGRKQRRELTAFISQDDGRSWSKGLMIDERIGCTYPDAQQTADGSIYLVWDYQRKSEQEILLTTFREEDVLSGGDEAQARVLANRRLVSKGGVE